MSDPTPVERLKAYCQGRELQQDGAGAVARFFRDAPVTLFKTLDDLRAATRFYGPNTSQSEISQAIEASGIVE